MMSSPADLAVLYEHPEWQKPLFQALDRRGVRYVPVDLKCAVFSDADPPLAPLYFNQASPSAYVRGNTRAVPYALAYLRALMIQGVHVLNGVNAFAVEISKTAQAALLRQLGVPAPRVWTFNEVDALRTRAHEVSFPVLLKPEQGGSGARIQLIESFAQLESLLAQNPENWLPDNLLLLQEYFPTDPEKGIVRMEFLGGVLLYAMRVISHGRFNLCPAPVCNPEDGEGGVCKVPAEQSSAPPVEFYPYPDVPAHAVAIGRRIAAAGKLDVGGIEYLETSDGRLVFYDINANSNLRPSIGEAFGFDPFERVVDYLVREMKRPAASGPRGVSASSPASVSPAARGRWKRAAR
jgi:glutathione synthase/RimK-type ligase-like ATP-grasp enzyme